MRSAQFGQSLAKPTPLGPEWSPWYWNPGRIGVKEAPAWFKAKLAEFDPALRVTWDVMHERWLVWNEAPRLRSKHCQGWVLLFVVRELDGSYRGLDERVFHRLVQASGRKWGRGKDYFDSVEREIARDNERARKQTSDTNNYLAGEYYDYMTIKNIGSGSKFANHFA